MLTPEILQQMAQGPAITAAAEVVESIDADGLYQLALPNNFTVHDLERFARVRRRARGTMTTNALKDFAVYSLNHAEAGAMVFVDAAQMVATAVLNLGGPESAGHADNTAKFTAGATAAFENLRAIADGRGKPQRTIAEFIEDWGPDHITCWHGDEELPHKQAVAAVRKVTIESLRRSESAVEQLSASRSTFDAIKASSGDQRLPSHLVFSCEPYKDLSARRFVVRLGVLTSGKEPELVLRMIKAEQHVEEMGEELVALVREAIDDDLPVLVGQYRALV